MGILEVENLTTGYDKKKVLNEIDLSLKKGDFIGIVGPNGSGKSTLIKAITKVLDPWFGNIKIQGIDLSELNRKEIASMLGVVPQNTYISFPYSVEEVVLMGRSPYKGKLEDYDEKDYKIVDKYLEETNTISFKDKKINNLSGGEIQRVVVARALSQEPEIILLDEATSHLDIGHKKEVMDTIKEKNLRDDLSVISIHHNLNLAARYCEKILLIDNGKRVAFGKPEEVLTEPNLRAVYGIEAEVHEHPSDGSLYIAPLDRTEIKERKEKSIHVICGGGTSENLFRRLIEEGYDVTAGVLNIMDTDYEKAEKLDINCVTEAPFSSITDTSCQKNLSFIRDSDILIITDFPIGEGNLKNLKMVKKVADKENKLIFIVGNNLKDRDHTENKKAMKIYKEMLEKHENKIEIMSSVREIITSLSS